MSRQLSMWQSARFCAAAAFSIALVLLPAASASAQAQAQAKVTPKEVLSNRDVIALVAAQLPSDLILAKIATASVAFDLSTSGLIELNRGRVPTEVVKAMMARAAGSPVASAPLSPGNPSVIDVGSAANPALIAGSEVAQPAEPGIYMYADSAGRRALMMLEPSAYSSGKSGGYLKSALTYGLAKTRTKAVVRGEQASIRTTDRRPVFYFVFEKTNGGLSGSGGPFFGNGVTSPNEFTMIRLTVAQGSRETVVQSSNAFGASSGTSDKAVVSFRFTRLKPGFYRVYFEQDVEPGEYCFLSAAGQQVAGAGMMGVTRLWDFGIR